MSKLTYMSNGSDWEALYIDGEKVADQHLDRLWPRTAIEIISENNITEAEISSHSPEYGEPFPKTLEEIDD